MRVLVFCPTYRLEPETLESLARLRWGDGFDVMLSFDNPYKAASPDDAERHRPVGRQNILYNYRKARKAALDGGYDALLTIESDIIAPPDTIARLVALDSDVAMGTYLFRAGRPVVSVYRWVVSEGGPDESLSLHPEILRRNWGKPYRCTGLGMGCTLIRRSVLEKVDFYADDWFHVDYSFARECLKRHIVMMADLGLLCGHKRPDGVILWPDPASPEGVRYEMAGGQAAQQ